jgi:hypothetical protein
VHAAVLICVKTAAILGAILALGPLKEEDYMRLVKVSMERKDHLIGITGKTMNIRDLQKVEECVHSSQVGASSGSKRTSDASSRLLRQRSVGQPQEKQTGVSLEDKCSMFRAYRSKYTSTSERGF